MNILYFTTKSNDRKIIIMNIKTKYKPNKLNVNRMRECGIQRKKGQKEKQNFGQPATAITNV